MESNTGAPIPGPYKAHGRTVKALDHGREHTIAVCDSRGWVSDFGERDMAAFIVRACNAHEALVEALEGLLEVCACRNGCAPDDMTCASNAARAALAKARA